MTTDLQAPRETDQQQAQPQSILLRCHHSLPPLAYHHSPTSTSPPPHRHLTATTESFSQYNEERLSTLASLKRRADKVASALDALPGVHCRPSDGALYAFPRVDLPDKFVKEVRRL